MPEPTQVQVTEKDRERAAEVADKFLETHGVQFVSTPPYQHPLDVQAELQSAIAHALAEQREAAEEGQRSRIEEIIKDEIEHIKIMLEGAKGHILSGWMGSAETAETLLAAIRATGVGSKP